MSKTVHLYPTAGAFILGEAAEEKDVSEADARRLLAYHPPAFTTDPPHRAATPTETPEPSTPVSATVTSSPTATDSPKATDFRALLKEVRD